MGTFANTAQIYAQSTDPGAVGAGKQWNDTTNNRQYVRNSTNTAWIELANEDSGIFGSDVQFAPSDYVITDSEFTSPTNCTVSSSDSANSGSVTSTTTIDNAATTAFSSLSSAVDSRYGEVITDTALRGVGLASITCNLKKVGAPTGNIVARIRKKSDDSIVATSANVDVSTIGAAYSDVTFTFTGATTPNEDFIVTVEYSGGDGANYVENRFTNGSSTYAGGYLTRYNGAYTDYAASDARMALNIANYAASLKDDKANPTTKKWQSNSEIGPWFKADMNTAQELLGIAIHFHANTDILSLKIETSADDVTYLRRKTVPYTLITEGAWKIILFPRSKTTVRYVKVTGLDAGAKTLSVNEIAILVLTESVINRRGRLVNYSDPTVSCETLTGA